MLSLVQEFGVEFWEKVRNDPVYTFMIDEIKEIYEDRKRDDFLPQRYSERMLFYTTGDRSAFEKTYFRRRHLLDCAAILALIYPEQEEYITILQDCIMMVCEEHCWALPAHTDGTLEDEKDRIDLFSAETAFELAEIKAFLGDRLDKKVCQYISIHVKSRVLDAYENRRQGWENADNNWAAVCAGSVGCAMMYEAPELLYKHLDRILGSMQCLLDSYPEDGTCLEGTGYWVYGFGAFLLFADMLYRFTNGERDLLDSEKVKTVAAYMQKNFLLGDTTVSFADGNRYGKSSYFMQYFLHKRYPDTVSLLPREKLSCAGNSFWTHKTRALMYYDLALPAQAIVKETYYLPDAAWYITTKDHFSFAAKAGYNAEPHNHNDVGNFLISTVNGQEIPDLGGGLYTRDYFRAETRYGIFCNGSQGHSLPIINGVYQKDGRQYNGTMTVNGNTVTVEMANAYPVENLQRLTRQFKVGDTSVKLTDSWDIDFETLTERFISAVKPTVGENTITLQAVTMRFDPKKCDLAISETEHLLHTAGQSETVYCIDFAVKKGEKAFTVIFEMR